MPTLQGTPVPRKPRSVVLCREDTTVTVVVPPPPSKSGTVHIAPPMMEFLQPSSDDPFLSSFLLNLRKAKQMFLTNSRNEENRYCPCLFLMKHVVCSHAAKRNVHVTSLSMSQRSPKCSVPVIYGCVVSDTKWSPVCHRFRGLSQEIK